MPSSLHPLSPSGAHPTGSAAFYQENEVSGSYRAPFTASRSSVAPQDPQVQISSRAPKAPKAVRDVTDDVRRSARAPHAGQGSPGIDAASLGVLSISARRFSSASTRRGSSFTVFQIGT